MCVCGGGGGGGGGAGGGGIKRKPHGPRQNHQSYITVKYHFSTRSTLNLASQTDNSAIT